MNNVDWDNFEDEADDDFLADGANPPEPPKACSILDGECEACQ